MNYSYRKHLEMIGEGSSNSVSYRNFECVSESLKRTMLGMASPKPEKWSKSSEYNNPNFLESCQGVAHDETHWFFTANGDDGRQGIFKYDQNMKKINELKFTGNKELISVSGIPTKKIVPSLPIEMPYFGHVGDPDCYNGKIYVPIQNPHGFLVMDTSLSVSSVRWYPTAKIGDSHPWCAIHPWNGKLFTSDFTGEDLNKKNYEVVLFAYNKETFTRESDYDIELKVPSFRIQGGCFSPSGHLFLSSDAKLKGEILKERVRLLLLGKKLPGHLTQILESDWPIEPCITVYSIVNGYYFGKIDIHRNSGITFFQEVEGITYWEKKEKRKNTSLHAVLLENELGTDEVFFKHFSASK